MDLLSPTQSFDTNMQTMTPVAIDANDEIPPSNAIMSSNITLLSENELLYARLAEEQQRVNKKKQNEIFDDTNWLEDFEELAQRELRK